MKKLFQRAAHNLGTEIIPGLYLNEEAEIKQDFFRISKEKSSTIQGLIGATKSAVRRKMRENTDARHDDAAYKRVVDTLKRLEGDPQVVSVVEPHPMRLCSVCQQFDYGTDWYPVRRLSELMSLDYGADSTWEMCSFLAQYIRRTLLPNEVDLVLQDEDLMSAPNFLHWDAARGYYRLHAPFEIDDHSARWRWANSLDDDIRIHDYDFPLWRITLMDHGNSHSSSARDTEEFAVLTPQEAQRGMPDVNQIKSWLYDCEASHQCGLPRHASMPPGEIRLIDVQSRTIMPHLPTYPRHTALSYVWGDVNREIMPPVQKENALTWKLPSVVPDTLEDAISITKQLGERYLWIDVYCIEQDDIVEKMRQIQQMDVIFSEAVLTIVSVSGRNAQSGLSGVSRLCEPRQMFASSDRRGLVATLVASKTQVLQTSPWNDRGWCLQEEVLSRRLLFLTDHHHWLRCQEHTYASHSPTREDYTQPRIKCESVRANWPMELRGKTLNDLEVSDSQRRDRCYNAYRRMVDNYNRRQLSYPTDAANAFIGVLNELKLATGDDFVMGLPAPHLSVALCWTQERNESISAAMKGLHRRPGWPSWSWLGWHGSVSWEDVVDRCRFSFFGRWLWDEAATGRSRWQRAPDLVQSHPCEFHPTFVEAAAAISLEPMRDELRLDSFVSTLHFCTTTPEQNDASYLHLQCMIYAPGVSWKSSPAWEDLRSLRDFDLVYEKSGRDVELCRFYIGREDVDQCRRCTPVTVAEHDRWEADFVMLQSIRSIGPKHRKVSDMSAEARRREGKNKSRGRHDRAEVWALLIVRQENGRARRAALVRLPVEVWRSGNPRKEVVVLE